ncbi:nuclear transport factor 2 family protein [Streptomyces kaniharaensis]|uniref:Nuclear transport factor 2 family protein n=1 Tax=Streptomyces kaniharaensis TaxID=212423 RepID=A0A6N7KY49_9ACTN|nr:nuclear transport factor 2 family protein [Streptomyces kaniharaensis]MQS15277.1 nuclear transport factor 2 family protein [Streptomyces kaniharaensis]
MTIATAKLSDPAVRTFVAAINAGDRDAFLAVLTPDATMSDDGSDRDLRDWIDKEIFTVRGRIDVQTESDGGHALIANFTNETWGEMRTAWRFTIDGGKISRFDTGQA